MSDLKFSPVDMQEMLEEGVLLAANESFFWPLGLALTWTFDTETGKYEGELHVREWREGGEWMRDTIELADDDEIGIERRRRFARWSQDRMAAIIKAAKEASEPRCDHTGIGLPGCSTCDPKAAKEASE